MALSLAQVTEPIWLKFEPVGCQFYRCVNLLTSGLHQQNESVLSSGGGRDSEEDNLDDSSILNPLLLDPTQWKDQDHYALLGLAKQRFKASPKDIRKAYQQQVLLHHPDKQDNKEDTTFKCIQIAYEILGDPKRRKAYDSVDPTFNDVVPVVSSNSKQNFYGVFDPIFKENARWSTVQPVPLLGDKTASLDEVESFYNFWYNFSSWREFSFLDEENPEKAECREERRWMEKQNKAARLKKKKEEMARIRQLVDNSYACDPRVKFFKEQEKENKVAQKKAKQEALKTEALRKDMEKKQKEEEAKRLRDLEEEQQRQASAQQRQEKEAYKKAIKKERKELRMICKDREYFTDSAEERIKFMQLIDYLCDTLSLQNLLDLNARLSGSSVTNVDCKASIEKEVSILKEKEVEEEKKATARTKTSLAGNVNTPWTKEEVQLLIKGVTTFPAGTAKRWEVIAKFVNDHSSDKCQEKTTSHVIDKVKALRKLDSSKGVGPATTKEDAFSQFEEKHSAKVTVANAPTQRDVSEVLNPWTVQEQKALEEAMRKYPSSTPQRWDKISAEIPSRSKEDCIARFKELVARVKAKK